MNDTDTRHWHGNVDYLRLIQPTAISPHDWGFHGPEGSGMVNVPIWHWHPVADFIQAYMPLHGYSGQAAGEFKS